MTTTSSTGYVSEPFIEEVIGGYRLHWVESGPTEMLVVELKHLHDDSRSGIVGEITVWNSFADDIPLLSGVRFNLLSERRRNDIAGRLKALNNLLPWEIIIEQVCRVTIQRHREGDRGTDIQPIDDDDLAVPQYILEPLILEGVPNVIYGDKGVAKTTLSLLAAGCIWIPWDDNPFGFKTNGKHHNVALLDYESNPELTLYALQRLRRGTNIPYFEISYRRCTRPIADEIEEIATFIDKKNIDVIIIDSMGSACGGDLMKPEPALQMFESLRKLGKTSLIIAQNAKGDDNKKTIFGSTYFTYYSRNIFELRKFGEFNEKVEANVALVHHESNYSGKYEPLGFHLTYTRDSIKVEPCHVSVAQLIEKAQMQQKILAALKEAAGSLTFSELKTITGAQSDSLKTVLSRMKNKGLIVSPTKGVYGLQAEGVDY